MFKTKKEKLLNEQESIIKLKEEVVQEIQLTEEQKFLQKLENKTKKDVICLRICDTDTKEIAINYLIKHGYICVENNFSCTQMTCYYSLTFAKEHLKDRF